MRNEAEKLILGAIEHAKAHIGVGKLAGAVREGMFEALVLLFESLLQAVHFQMGLHAGLYFLKLERFGNIVGGRRNEMRSVYLRCPSMRSEKLPECPRAFGST